MPNYEIHYVRPSGETAIHYWPACAHERDVSFVARRHLRMPFALAEVWRDAERIDLLFREANQF
jgi:hypothetical protein